MHHKKGFIGILLNPIVIAVIIIMLILVFTLPSSPFKLAIFNIGVSSFAGFDFNTAVNNYHVAGGCDGNIAMGGELLNLNIRVSGSSAGSGCEVIAITQQPINDVDEFLVIYDSTHSTTQYMNIGSGIFLSDRNNAPSNMLISFSEESSDGIGRYLEPKVIKIKNNFDGTYSILTSLGVGDVFIVRTTKTMPNVPLYLGIWLGGGGGAGGSSASGSVSVYNIVRKENAFAICKADEYLTTDSSGNFVCKPLSTIVLNSEEAIKESFDEKLIRITAELEAKNAGLTADITALKQQLAQQQTTEQITVLEQKIKLLESELATASDKTLIQTQIDLLRQQQLESSNIQDRLFALESELKLTKSVLADVQAKDKTVVNVITQQEQFKKPNFIKEFFNKIIAWIKNLFT